MTISSTNLQGVGHTVPDSQTLGFQYGTTMGGPYPNATPHTTIGDLSANQPYSELIAGLLPSTTYYFIAAVYNELDAIVAQSAECSFATVGATCEEATEITTEGATLNATFDNVPVTQGIQIGYSLTAGGPIVGYVPAAPVAGANTFGQALSGPVTGLDDLTTYFYRPVVRSGLDPSDPIIYEGSECEFTTLEIFGFIVPATWERCPNPNWLPTSTSYGDEPEPTHWKAYSSGSAGVACAALGAAPTGQAMSLPWNEINDLTSWPANPNQIIFGTGVSASGAPPVDIYRNYRRISGPSTLADIPYFNRPPPLIDGFQQHSFIVNGPGVDRYYHATINMGPEHPDRVVVIAYSWVLNNGDATNLGFHYTEGMTLGGTPFINAVRANPSTSSTSRLVNSEIWYAHKPLDGDMKLFIDGSNSAANSRVLTVYSFNTPNHAPYHTDGNFVEGTPLNLNVAAGGWAIALATRRQLTTDPVTIPSLSGIDNKIGRQNAGRHSFRFGHQVTPVAGVLNISADVASAINRKAAASWAP